MRIFREAAHLEEANEPFALATIIETRGSAPRRSAQMLIRQDGSLHGTVGGGIVERLVVTEALAAMAEKRSRTITGALARREHHSECPGEVKVHIDVHCKRPVLLLVGAGHVNRALAQTAQRIGFEITVADTHKESLDPALFPPGTILLHGESYTAAIEQAIIDDHTYAVIGTNHEDKESLGALINTPAAYIGMLGSRNKIRAIYDYWRARNVSQQQLDFVHAPIGLNIGAETPDELAISIMGEIMSIKTQSAATPIPAFNDQLVVIRSAGDIATGVAVRLHNCGFKVVMLEIARPTVIRTSVSFAQAQFDGSCTVEGITARQANTIEEARAILERGEVPILTDAECSSLAELKPVALVDAILAKHNTGSERDMAPITVGLGPGFHAGEDVDAVVETNRGHHLARVIYDGPAAPNTGIPGNIAGHTDDRVLRSPCAGLMQPRNRIGDIVEQGAVIAHVGSTEVHATIGGMIRGMLNPGIEVPEGFKIGDIDPRGAKADFTTVSDKARAVSGGVLEAILHLRQKL